MPVRLLVPRSERRLTRAMHAFGPVPGMAFSVMNQGARERCIEDDLGTGQPIGVVADTFLRAFEQALEARGVPFSVVEALGGEAPLQEARWIVCATSGALAPALFDRLVAAHELGAAITIGPEKPTRDGSFRRVVTPLPWETLGTSATVPLFVDDAPASADNAVARAIESLRLPTFACDPHQILATVHEDATGKPRVVFVANPTDADLIARVSVGETGYQTARDLFNDEHIPLSHGALEARTPPKTVRMFALT